MSLVCFDKNIFILRTLKAIIVASWAEYRPQRADRLCWSTGGERSYYHGSHQLYIIAGGPQIKLISS